MVSIKKLERMIKPYETSNWGGSDGFGNTFQEYSKEGIKTRLDSRAWFLVKNSYLIRKSELVRVANELGLKID